MDRARLLAIAALASAPSLVLAQASAPLTREQVNAETRAAQKAGELTPAGVGGAKPAASGAQQKSVKTRAERKAEVVEARKKGELVPAGVGNPATGTPPK